MKTNLCFNKTCVIALTLVVCLLASMFITSLVKAEDGPFLSNELRHIFHPSFVENNESQTIGSLQVGFFDQPYMAGYMTTDYLSGNPNETTANAVRVTVSFKGTDNSIIQDGNALAAGIAAQGPSSSGKVFPPEPFIDYGYTLLLVVDNQYDWPFIQGVVWEVIEWGPNNLWPLEDPEVNIASYVTWEFPLVLTMDSNVTLIMKWDSNPDVLSFSAIIDDWPEYPIQALIPNDIQLPYFMLGTAEREHKLEPLIDLPGTVKFFQFVGAWSNENIGQEGWHSYLSYPGFRRDEEWTNVTFAYSVNGTTSWLDNTVNWGGVCYDNVTADYTCQHLHFYPTSDGTTLETDTLLWASHTLSISATSGGTTEPTPGTYTYGEGESVIVTATAYSNYFFDYWLLDGVEYGSDPTITIMMDSDHTLEAHFERLYTLTIVASEGGTTEPTPGTYQFETPEAVYITAFPYPGYGFDWFIDGEQIPYHWNPIGLWIDRDCTIEARFANHYNLSISSTLWGRTDPYDGTYTYEYEESVTITAIPWDDCAFDYWILDGETQYDNPITVVMNYDHALKAYFHDLNPGGGGSCPTLYVWNGTAYVDYGVIDIHNPSGEDVIQEVTIQAEDVGISSYKAVFRLREGWPGLNFSESVIDQVKLYAVDSNGDRHLCPLISATHSRLGNVWLKLLASDDYKAQMLLLETIDLTFIMPYQNVQSYIFVIEGCNQFKQ